MAQDVHGGSAGDDPGRQAQRPHPGRPGPGHTDPRGDRAGVRGEVSDPWIPEVRARLPHEAAARVYGRVRPALKRCKIAAFAMTRPRFLLAAFLLCSSSSAGPAAAQPVPLAEGVRTLTVQYADGRATSTPIGTSGRVSWTAAFPRIAGADTARDGLPLNALQFEEAPGGQTLVVTLALMYGSPHQSRVPVATVKLRDERPVRVGELEAYGVKPIVLSIVTLPPAELRVPSITTPSSLLEVKVDAVSGDAPLYRITVTNRSTQNVMGFAFKGYRGSASSASGKPRGQAGLPLIAPGKDYVVTLRASARNGAEWSMLDRIEITSVTWSDGLVEGDPKPAADTRIVDSGTARQLSQIVPIFRAAAQAPEAHPIPKLRDDIAALSITVNSAGATADAQSLMRIGMQNAKNAALNDIAEVSRTAPLSPEAYRAWLTAAAAKFDGWLTRIRQF